MVEKFKIPYISASRNLTVEYNDGNGESVLRVLNRLCLHVIFLFFFFWGGGGGGEGEVQSRYSNTAEDLHYTQKKKEIKNNEIILCIKAHKESLHR